MGSGPPLSQSFLSVRVAVGPNNILIQRPNTHSWLLWSMFRGEEEVTKANRRQSNAKALNRFWLPPVS
jgi:hypothetical protein